MVDVTGLAKRAGHLAKRAVAHEYPHAKNAIAGCNKYLKKTRPSAVPEQYHAYDRRPMKAFEDLKLTGAQTTVLVITAVFLILLCGAWSYIQKFVMTLTVVEAPAPPNYVEAESNTKPAADADSDSKGLLEQPETPAPAARTTASLRDTIRRIRTTPGSLGLLHGAGAYVVYKFAYIATLFLGALVASNLTSNLSLTTLFGAVFASFVTARLSMAALHVRIAIRQPNEQRASMCRRLKSLRWVAVRKTVFPLIFMTTASRFANVVFNTAGDLKNASPMAVFTVVAAIFASLLCIPAKLVLMRQQASTLPYADDCFVNLDTSFGVAAAQTDADADEPTPLTFIQAAKSFRWADVKHIVKMQVKLTVVGIAFGLALFPLLFGIAFLVGLSGPVPGRV